MAAAQFSSNNPSTASKHSALTFDLRTSSVTMGEKKRHKDKDREVPTCPGKSCPQKTATGLTLKKHNNKHTGEIKQTDSCYRLIYLKAEINFCSTKRNVLMESDVSLYNFRFRIGGASRGACELINLHKLLAGRKAASF